jgi:hypothetical protein
MPHRTRRNVFPELLLLGTLGVGLYAGWRPAVVPPASPLVELPIPAPRLLGGTAPLSPGQWVTLKAFGPEVEGFVPQCYAGVEIRELEMQDTGLVLAALPADRVAALEAALANDKVRLTYHLVERLPDGSLAPTADTCPPPVASAPVPQAPDARTDAGASAPAPDAGNP